MFRQISALVFTNIDLKKSGIVGALLLFSHEWNIRNKTPLDRFDDVAAVRLADLYCPTVFTDGEKHF